MTWSRLVFVLAVMAGVVLMHSLVLSPHTPENQPGHHAGPPMVAAEVIQTPDPVQNCDVGSECSDTWVLHVCAAILAAVITGAAASTFRRAIAVLRIGIPRGPAPPRVERLAARSSGLPLEEPNWSGRRPIRTLLQPTQPVPGQAPRFEN